MLSIKEMYEAILTKEKHEVKIYCLITVLKTCNGILFSLTRDIEHFFKKLSYFMVSLIFFFFLDPWIFINTVE